MTDTPQTPDSGSNPPENQQPQAPNQFPQESQPTAPQPPVAGQLPVAAQPPVSGQPPVAAQPPVYQQPQPPLPPQYTQPIPPHQVHGQQAPTNQGPTQPLNPNLPPNNQWAPPSAFAKPAKRPNKTAVSLVAAVVVGALVGGGAAAGVTALIINNSNQGSLVQSSSAVTPQNITVNDRDNATIITKVAAEATPSVVTINVTGTDSAGTGSGVILTADGYVLTNTHVVTLDGEVATAKISVTSSDGHLYTAKVIGTDPISDLAVIKLDNASGLAPITFADSSKLNVGDTAVAIGAPLALSNTVTNGIVSALNRSITIASSAAPKGDSSDGSTPNDGSGGSGTGGPFDFWQFGSPNGGDQGQQQQQQPSTVSNTIALSVIQTDAPINPGNSGGALLDSDGKVMGINVAIASAGDDTSGGQSGSIGVGFAIPSNLAKRIANEIMSTGTATHGLLGATVSDVTADASTKSAVVGASIQSVTSGGAAAGGGLQKGDVVTSFNGVPISGSDDLTAQVRVLAAGSKAQLTYIRGGKSYTTTVTLGKLTS